VDSENLSHQFAEAMQQADGPVVLDLFRCRVLPEKKGVLLVYQVEATEIQSPKSVKGTYDIGLNHRPGYSEVLA
jgi:hypothetical protein